MEDLLFFGSSFSDILEKLVLSGIKGQLVVLSLSRISVYKKVKIGAV